MIPFSGGKKGFVTLGKKYGGGSHIEANKTLSEEEKYSQGEVKKVLLSQDAIENMV